MGTYHPSTSILVVKNRDKYCPLLGRILVCNYSVPFWLSGQCVFLFHLTMKEAKNTAILVLTNINSEINLAASSICSKDTQREFTHNLVWAHQEAQDSSVVRLVNS